MLPEPGLGGLLHHLEPCWQKCSTIFQMLYLEAHRAKADANFFPVSACCFHTRYVSA
jgi:hypothetical protein